MKHLRLFETENEHTSEVDNLELPCITYVEETSEIEIYPKVNCCIATYNISDTLNSSKILGNGFNSSQIQTMLIDGVEVEPTSQYKFTTTGEHTVKIILNKNFFNANGMFANCTSLTSLDLSKFDTSNVTAMASMFLGCTSLTSLDLSNFDTSNVTGVSQMFSSCTSLTSLNLSSFSTSKVTAMTGMFDNCTSLTSLDLSNFDTSNVTNMSSMFNNCTSLTSLDLSNFDTSNVTGVTQMFSGCTSLTSLDLSNFDTSKVTNMYRMFNNCTSLTSLDLSSFNTSNVTNMNGIFDNCTSLTSLKMIGDINKLRSTGSMFSNITTTGTFYYNSVYDYSKIIAKLPSTWTTVAV